MTDATLDYAPLDPETSLRYARAAEARYAGHELPPPDLEPGDCDECGHHAHHRWTHGKTRLCRHCLRKRHHAARPQPDTPRPGGHSIPRFHGECQRCRHPAARTMLALIAHLFLCPIHAKRAARAERAAKARAQRERTR